MQKGIVMDRIAVLIDAENTSVKYIEVVLKELKQYGDISVQRMYGDFSNPVMSEWSKKGLEYAIVPIHQARYTASKNASDIMLVIDAMDILFQGSADIFCIVSSDSDFTRLASRLRAGGRRVGSDAGMANPRDVWKKEKEYSILRIEPTPVKQHWTSTRI